MEGVWVAGESREENLARRALKGGGRQFMGLGVSVWLLSRYTKKEVWGCRVWYSGWGMVVDMSDRSDLAVKAS